MRERRSTENWARQSHKQVEDNTDGPTSSLKIHLKDIRLIMNMRVLDQWCGVCNVSRTTARRGWWEYKECTWKRKKVEVRSSKFEIEIEMGASRAERRRHWWWCRWPGHAGSGRFCCVWWQKCQEEREGLWKVLSNLDDHHNADIHFPFSFIPRRDPTDFSNSAFSFLPARFSSLGTQQAQAPIQYTPWLWNTATTDIIIFFSRTVHTHNGPVIVWSTGSCRFGEEPLVAGDIEPLTAIESLACTPSLRVFTSQK